MTTIPQAVGDWTLRGVDADQVFSAQALSDQALSAAVRVSARFDPAFPGWQLYRRIVAGVTLFDTTLEDWAVTTAQLLATSTRRTGRQYIRAASVRPEWVAQAARDALDHAVCGRFPAALGERGERFGVSPKTYQAIRDPMALCLRAGFEHFAAELRLEYFRVRKEDVFDGNGTGPIPIVRMNPGSPKNVPDLVGNGCFITNPTGNPDYL